MSERANTLITGTSRGIGKALARHYLARGHRVFGVSRGETGLKAEGYHHHAADVTDEGSIRDLFRHIRRQHGTLHHLINNAGIAAMNHAMTMPLDTARRILETNVLGTFLPAREAAKQMSRARWGRIVNFSTIAVPRRLEGEALYAASKSAVETLTSVLARELGGLGITVNAVGPVPILTDLVAGVPEDKLDQLVARQAIRRYGTFEDVANVIDFFLRRESSLVTGQTLYLGGL